MAGMLFSGLLAWGFKKKDAVHLSGCQYFFHFKKQILLAYHANNLV